MCRGPARFLGRAASERRSTLARDQVPTRVVPDPELVPAFLSVALLTRMRRCHFLSLYNCALLLLDMDFPYESRFLQSIIVDNPLS